MKKMILAMTAGCALAGAALASPPEQHVYGDVARVISATPIHERLAYPRRECRVEGDPRPAANTNPAPEVRRCDEVADARDHIVGYDVRYEYNGREFRTRMPFEPGPQIPVNVEVRPPIAYPASGPRPPRYRGTY